MDIHDSIYIFKLYGRTMIVNGSIPSDRTRLDHFISMGMVFPDDVMEIPHA